MSPVYPQYEAELERMQQVKAENMAMFIQREREDIINLWDELYYSEDERASFDLLHCGESLRTMLLDLPQVTIIAYLTNLQ